VSHIEGVDGGEMFGRLLPPALVSRDD
jgi:hypothetical protein